MVSYELRKGILFENMPEGTGAICQNINGELKLITGSGLEFDIPI